VTIWWCNLVRQFGGVIWVCNLECNLVVQSGSVIW
jgi:hypothetical protein